MIYLATASGPAVRAAMRDEPWLGVLVTPKAGTRADLPGVPWAVDNGSVMVGRNGAPESNPEWDGDAWLRWLDAQDRDALFVAVPDVVGDWRATQRRWSEYARIIRLDMGFRAAYVLQDGAPDFPHEADAVFVGGSTAYKLSADARKLVVRARSLGKWAHMGRVNSERRLRIAASWPCDSVDGTYLAFAPHINLVRLRRFMRRATEPMLWTPDGCTGH